MSRRDENERLRATLLRNAQSILQARERSEEELRRTKEALERRSAELAEEKRLLEVLNQAGRAIASTLDLEALLQLVTDAATELSGAEFGAFFYNTVNESGDAYQLYVLAGAPREKFESLGMPRATPIFGPTFRGEGVVRCDDVHADPRYGRLAPHHGMPEGHLPVRSYLAVPVASRSGQILGGLFFGHPQPAVFDGRAERLVLGVAAYAAVAIDNARLYDETRRAAEERARLLESERETRAELERISLMKDEFLATLSHELRTPLNAVLGWSEILRGQADEPEQRNGLETIARNARAQAQMIDDLLDMNRIVSGKVRLDLQYTDLTTVIDTAVDSAGPSALAKGIRLRKIVDTGVGAVLGDPNRLQQVVWNLLSNAVKFTPKGGTIDVRVERVDSQVEISVRDSGVGIHPDFFPHLFERFRQADSSTTRRYGGLGLGLSIVKHLTELHGGSVRADSEGEGRGATFTVSLPLGVLRDAGRERATTPPARRPLKLSGVRVLVVDDEPDARELLRVALESREAQVAMADSADAALEQLAAGGVDVLVSDIEMPEKDGYELVQELRKLPPARGGRTPAIALTAFARSEDRTRAMLAGYQVHVAKPVEIEDLIATVANLAEQAL